MRLEVYTRHIVAVLFGALGVALSGCATQYNVAPIADNSQQIRYERGQPTIYSEMQFGAVQVTSLGVNGDKRLGFRVAAFNKGTVPSNFGVENISLVQADGSPDKIMTASELEHEAQVQADWNTLAVSLTAVSQSISASQAAYTTTTGTADTSEGPVSFSSQSYNPALAQQGIDEAGVEMNANLHSIEDTLDHTVNSIRDNVLQTTTVDPGNSYGGIAVANKLSSSIFPQEVTLHVNWNGEDHLFRFAVAKGANAVIKQQAQSAALPVVTSVGVAKLPIGTAPNASTQGAGAHESSLASYDQWGISKHEAGAPSE
jgi:hypothetical protein